MSKEKRSFFERLTGAVRMEDDQEDSAPAVRHIPPRSSDRLAAQSEQRGARAESRNLGSSMARGAAGEEGFSNWIEEETEKDAELTVDVYQTADSIVVKSMIAGVRPDDLDVSITRDVVTIRGKREEERVSQEDDYYVRELYWGSFSRSISLPEEIDVDGAEAIEKHGLLILKLPKLDKKRQSKLKVKTG